MSRVTLSQAKADLVKLIDEAGKGGEVTILREGMPVAKLVPAAPARLRRPGRYKGCLAVPASFFEPLPREELEVWGET